MTRYCHVICSPGHVIPRACHVIFCEDVSTFIDTLVTSHQTIYIEQQTAALTVYGRFCMRCDPYRIIITHGIILLSADAALSLFLNIFP